MKKIVSILLLITILIAGCGKENPEKKKVLDLIEKNKVVTQNEDFEETMNTIHPESPVYESSSVVMKQLFALYDLKYELTSVEVVSIDDDTAVVAFEQVTTKISGPDFRNSKIKGEHQLRKYNGEWKIYSTTANKVEFFDK